MKKEHEESVRKAEDLQMLRNKEIEYIQLQKQNAEKQENIRRLTQNLSHNIKPNLQPVQQPVLHQPVLSPELAHILKQSTNSDLMLQQERERNKLLENEMNNMKRQHEYALKMNELKNMQDLQQSSKIRLIDNDNNSVASSKTSMSSKSAVSFNPQIADIFQKKN
jgi:hypothetical protein